MDHDKDTIAKLVKDMVRNNLGVADADYDREKTFTDMGADSLDEIEMIMYLEEELSIDISDDKAEKCKTPALAEEMLQELLS